MKSKKKGFGFGELKNRDDIEVIKPSDMEKVIGGRNRHQEASPYYYNTKDNGCSGIVPQ